MTTGRSGLIKTPFGQIEFTHTKRNISNILNQTRDIDRPLRIATPNAAVRDLRRVGHNVHLIDTNELKNIIANDQ
ncbi:MAG: hypothetical protein OXC68_08745 [Aestuariivita sp.]|nr:hypothetical protein [Aestuariivita sp.]